MAKSQIPDSIKNGEEKKKLIDPRGPRFGAAITSVLLLVVVALSLLEQVFAATILLTVIVVLFAWGAIFGPSGHPYGFLFKKLVRPRLADPEYLEEEAPPKFAQLVGFIVTFTGLVFALFGFSLAITIAAGIAFIAAFLNAVFNFCLGCEIYGLAVKKS